MDQMVVITFISLIMFELGDSANQFCAQKQSLELGQTGIISCSFEDIYFGLYWYDTPDLMQQPILYKEDGGKGGVGYISGEYDLAPDGSLFITNVTIKHERTFVVVLVKTVVSEYIGHEVVVDVIAYPTLPYPVIDRCMNKRHCYTVISDNDPLSCKVVGTRPPVYLTWLRKTSTYASDVTTNRTYSSMGVLNTTNTVMRFHHSLAVGLRFHLFICKSSQTAVLSNLTSFTIAEEIVEDMTFDHLIETNGRIGDTLSLPCDGTTSLFVIWKRIVTKTQYQTIGYTYDEAQHYVHPYVLYQNGTLTVHQINEEYEGVYVCIASNGLQELITAYRLIFDSPTTVTNMPMPKEGTAKWILIPILVLSILVFPPLIVLIIHRRRADKTTNTEAGESSSREFISINSSRGDQKAEERDAEERHCFIEIKHFLVGHKASKCEEKVVIVIQGLNSKGSKLEIDWEIFKYWSGVDPQNGNVDIQKMDRNIDRYIYKFREKVSATAARNFTFIVITAPSEDANNTGILFKEVTAQLIYMSSILGKYKLNHVHAVVVVKRFTEIPSIPSRRHFFHPILRMFGKNVSEKVYLVLVSDSTGEYKSYKRSSNDTEDCENYISLESLKNESLVSFEQTIEVLGMRKTLAEDVGAIEGILRKLAILKNPSVQEMSSENVPEDDKEKTRLINYQEATEDDYKALGNGIIRIKTILSDMNKVSLTPSVLTLVGSDAETQITENVNSETSSDAWLQEISRMFRLENSFQNLIQGRHTLENCHA